MHALGRVAATLALLVGCMVSMGGCREMRRWTLGGPVDEPEFSVVARQEGFELRAYGPMVVAETEVDGDAFHGGNQGFGTLAGYIFGGNAREQSIAMTAPVAMQPSSTPGRSVMRFSMPSDQTLATLPQPRDPRVKLKLVPAGRMATVRFGGTWDPSNVQQRVEQLERDVLKAGLRSTGAAVFARYDPPWTPGFMRRNEILLPVE